MVYANFCDIQGIGSSKKSDAVNAVVECTVRSASDMRAVAKLSGCKIIVNKKTALSDKGWDKYDLQISYHNK